MKTKTLRSLVAIGITIFAVTGLYAEISGKTVIENVYNRPVGKTMQADLKMVITNARGATREREIVQNSIDTNAGDKKIMFFLNPADVRSTSFMTWSWNDGRDDDQWIYLPALKRIKRITSDGKTDSFMGSDFTYDDLGDRHPSEDTHSLIGEEKIDGLDCYVVESIPVVRNNLYVRTITRVLKDSWVGVQKDFYNGKEEIVKTLIITRREKVDGYWVVTDMTMKDLQKGSSTRITMENVSFSVALDEPFFSERQMRLGPRR